MAAPNQTIRDTGYVASKAFTVGDTRYAPGDPFDATMLPDHKVGQLLSQRFIRPATDIVDP